MHKEVHIPFPIPGKIVFAFSFVEGKSGDRFYHVYYNEELDEHKGTYQICGAMYKMMKENPFLIEPMLHVTQLAAEELSEPFEEILKQK